MLGVVGEKVALDGNLRAISGKRTYLAGSLDRNDSRNGSPISHKHIMVSWVNCGLLANILEKTMEW